MRNRLRVSYTQETRAFILFKTVFLVSSVCEKGNGVISVGIMY